MYSLPHPFLVFRIGSAVHVQEQARRHAHVEVLAVDGHRDRAEGAAERRSGIAIEGEVVGARVAIVAEAASELAAGKRASVALKQTHDGPRAVETPLTRVRTGAHGRLLIQD